METQNLIETQRTLGNFNLEFRHVTQAIEIDLDAMLDSIAERIERAAFIRTKRAEVLIGIWRESLECARSLRDRGHLAAAKIQARDLACNLCTTHISSL